MEDHIKIKLVMNKEFKRKLLHVTASGHVDELEKYADKLIDRYEEIIKENPGISMIVNVQNITGMPKLGVLKKYIDRLLKFNDVAKKNLCSSAVIVNAGFIVSFIKLVTKNYPSLTDGVENEICYSPQRALAFTKEVWMKSQ